jgi:hypothetical protein
MKVPELFNIYKELRSSIKYCPYRNGIDSIFVDYKEKFNGFQNSEIETLEVYLSHNEDRWFVFYLLNVIYSSPEELFEPLMTSILSFGCDSWRYGSTYDNMARLYGFEKVELFLQQKFDQSYSDIYKRSIVDAMWRNSYSKPYVIPDDDLDFITVFRYVWKDNWYQFLEFIPDSQEEARKMLNDQEILIQNRYRLLLEHFLKHQISPEFFQDCSVVLPRRRESYKNENIGLFDKLIGKLRLIKNENNSNFSQYLKNPVNKWEWI